VKEHIPEAVQIATELIPSEMRIVTDVSWNILTIKTPILDASGNSKINTEVKYKLTINDLNDPSGNQLYRFYVSNDISGNDTVKKEIYSLEDDPKSFIFDASYNNVGLYGKQVNDFHTLGKSKIFTIAIPAIQEIDRKQLADQAKIVVLETKVADLETENATLKSQQSGIEARLAALEAK